MKFFSIIYKSLTVIINNRSGPVHLDVTYDGNAVDGSPFAVEALMAPDPSKVKVYGPGLSTGVVGREAPFTIETIGAGKLDYYTCHYYYAI